MIRTTVSSPKFWSKIPFLFFAPSTHGPPEDSDAEVEFTEVHCPEVEVFVVEVTREFRAGLQSLDDLNFVGVSARRQ